MDLKKAGCENGNWIHAIKVLDIDNGPRLQTPKFLEACLPSSSGRMGKCENLLRETQTSLFAVTIYHHMNPLKLHSSALGWCVVVNSCKYSTVP